MRWHLMQSLRFTAPELRQHRTHVQGRLLGRGMSERLRNQRRVVLLRHQHSWTGWMYGEMLRVQLFRGMLPLLYVHKDGLRREDNSLWVLENM